jgi:hypothetical protein
MAAAEEACTLIAEGQPRGARPARAVG